MPCALSSSLDTVAAETGKTAVPRYYSKGSDRRNHAQTATMSALATKQQSLKIFEKLKLKPANKVWKFPSVTALGVWMLSARHCLVRYASTAARRIPHGRRFLSASICVWTAPPITVTWVYTSPLCGRQTSIVCIPNSSLHLATTIFF